MTDEFAELDRQLTEANLAHASVRKALADESAYTAALARQFEATGDKADRLGEIYLRARFDHEAKQAGLYVDGSVFEVSGVVPGLMGTSHRDQEPE